MSKDNGEKPRSAKEWQKLYMSLQARYNGLCETSKARDETITELARRVVQHEQQLENANQNVAQQKQVVIDNLDQSQGEKDEMVKEIMRLRKILRENGIKVP